MNQMNFLWFLFDVNAITRFHIKRHLTIEGDLASGLSVLALTNYNFDIAVGIHNQWTVGEGVWANGDQHNRLQCCMEQGAATG